MSFTAPSFCSTDRQDIKHGNDSGASSVSQNSGFYSILQLLLNELPPLPWGGNDTSSYASIRNSPYETHRWTITGLILQWNYAGTDPYTGIIPGPWASIHSGDGDLCIDLEDVNGVTIHAEIPHPNCCDPAGPFYSDIVAARTWADSLIAAGGLPAGTMVQVNGAGMFDMHYHKMATVTQIVPSDGGTTATISHGTTTKGGGDPTDVQGFSPNHGTGRSLHIAGTGTAYDGTWLVLSSTSTSCKIGFTSGPSYAGAGTAYEVPHELHPATDISTPLSWATPSPITQGTALSATQLNASSTIAGSFSYSPPSGTILGVGTHVLTATFTPTDPNVVTGGTVSVTITVVAKITPTITWSNPSAITYGTALSGTQLNATSGGVAGAFAYTPSSGTVLNAGTQTLSTTFTPSDTSTYNTVTKTVTITVNQVTPSLSWSAPSSITSGTALSGTQLDATSGGVAGSFSYSPASGTVLSTGTHTLTATFTPTDTTNYVSGGTVSTTITVTTVTKTTPTITWTTPAPITYPTALSGTQLNATSGGVAGTFAYTPAAGTIPNPGIPTLSVTFTPTDTSTYNSATASVTLTVNQITPSLSWPTPDPIILGAALSDAQLDASCSNASGTFSYSSPAGTILPAGNTTVTATFTPFDVYHLAGQTVSTVITVNAKTNPTITWSNPSAITYGTALSGTQLNATSGGVSGTFTYTPTSGTVLNAGTQTLSVTFTPSDTATYNTVSKTVTLTVNQVTPSLSWSAPSAITYGAALSGTQLDATSGGVAGTFSYGPPSGTILNAGIHTLTATFTPTDTVNYVSGLTVSVTLTVNQITPSLSWSTPSAITYGTALSATQLNASCSTTPGPFSYSSPAGDILGAGSHTIVATFTPDDAINYASGQTVSVTLTVNQATPVLSWATPAPIVDGTALSSTQLDASANILYGVFVYSSPIGTVLGVGSHTVTATYTPQDTTNYVSGGTVSVTIFVNHAGLITPTLSWATPAPIIHGTALSGTQLDATSGGVAGTFAYSPSSGTTLDTGYWTLTATFSPTDPTTYASGGTVSVTLRVNQATPVLTWTTPSPITHGTALSATQLDASADVGGTFSYSEPIGDIPPLGVNILTATFTPTDTVNYVSGETVSVSITVEASTLITPLLSWDPPPSIPYPTPLSATQLNAAADVDGTFVYNPPANKVLLPGNQTLTATFTPTDTVHYESGDTVSVVIAVYSQSTGGPPPAIPGPTDTAQPDWQPAPPPTVRGGLTPNQLNHIKQTYRAMLKGRLSNVTLFFADGSSQTIPAIWRQNDLNNPELLPQAKPPNNPQAASVDAAFEVLTDDVSIGTLQAVNYVIPQPYGGITDAGIAARYLIISIQPRGLAFPPVRAYVMLRKA